MLQHRWYSNRAAQQTKKRKQLQPRRDQPSESALTAEWAEVAALTTDKAKSELVDRTVDQLHTLGADKVCRIASMAGQAGLSYDPPWDDLWRRIELVAAGWEDRARRPADSARLVWGLGAARYHAPVLLDKIAAQFITEGPILTRTLNLQDSARALWAYAMLDYASQSPRSPELFQAFGGPIAAWLTDAKPADDAGTAAALSSLLWAHAVANVPNRVLFSTSVFTESLRRMPWSVEADMSRLHQYRLWCDERKMKSGLPEPLAAECKRAFSCTQVSPSVLQREVAATLDMLNLAHMHEHRLEEGYTLDIACEYRGVLVGIEVDGPQHFLGNLKGTPTGATQLKRRQLKHLGYRVLPVPYFTWQQAPDQSSYLLEALDELIGPQHSAYYELGLDPLKMGNYSNEDVINARNAALQQHHPDRNPTERRVQCHARTTKIIEAYQLICSSPEWKAAGRAAREEQQAEAARAETLRAVQRQRMEAAAAMRQEAEERRRREEEALAQRQRAHLDNLHALRAEQGLPRTTDDDALVWEKAAADAAARREEEARASRAAAAEARAAEQAAAKAAAEAAAEAYARESAAAAAAVAEGFWAERRYWWRTAFEIWRLPDCELERAAKLERLLEVVIEGQRLTQRELTEALRHDPRLHSRYMRALRADRFAILNHHLLDATLESLNKWNNVHDEQMNLPWDDDLWKPRQTWDAFTAAAWPEERKKQFLWIDDESCRTNPDAARRRRYLEALQRFAQVIHLVHQSLDLRDLRLGPPIDYIGYTGNRAEYTRIRQLSLSFPWYTLWGMKFRLLVAGLVGWQIVKRVDLLQRDKKEHADTVEQDEQHSE